VRWNCEISLDTNIISELVKREPNSGVVRWIDDHGEDTLFLSVLSSESYKRALTS